MENPVGIINTIEYVQLNNQGGLDVTEDILLNIDEQSLVNKEVEMKKISTIFKISEKSEVVSIKKAVNKKLNPYVPISELYAGYFVNVDRNEAPFFVIAYRTTYDFDLSAVEVKKAIYSQFLKHLHFEFLNLSEDSEVSQKLIKQGIKII